MLEGPGSRSRIAMRLRVLWGLVESFECQLVGPSCKWLLGGLVVCLAACLTFVWAVTCLLLVVAR